MTAASRVGKPFGICVTSHTQHVECPLTTHCGRFSLYRHLPQSPLGRGEHLLEPRLVPKSLKIGVGFHMREL
jgi:hypothetical protein